jgi:hypothetical protein
MCLAVLSAIAGAVKAEVPTEVLPSDVSVTLTASPNSGLLVGQAIHLQLSVTNNGPVPLDNVFISSAPFSGEFDWHGFSSDCHMSGFIFDWEGPPFFYQLNWFLTLDTGLAVGETRTCHFQMMLTPQATPVTSLTFGLPNYFADPDSSNDQQTLFLQRALDSIPATSPQALAILACFLATFGWLALHRRPHCAAAISFICSLISLPRYASRPRRAA